MRFAALTLTLTAMTGVTATTDTYPRQPGVDAIHYRFSIVLDEASTHLDAETTATFRVLAPVDAIEVDLMDAMTVSAVTTAGSAAVDFTHENDRLRMPLPRGVASGSDVTYTIKYAGTPAQGLRAYTNLHGERVMFSQGWPNRARHWLPTIDHPYDKATGEMIVTAPSRWQVVSNGVLVEEVDLDDGRRRTHWRQSIPIASWLYAVGVGRFAAHHAGEAAGVPLQTWSFPEDRDAARVLFEETSRRAMQFFTDRVGDYPYEKLANVQASGFGGGMENATVIFYGEKGVASRRGPVVHEIAHQWFGNSVTERDWDDVWLSEGFASYFTHLYREHAEGRDAFVDALARSRRGVLDTSRKLANVPVVHRNLDDMSRVLNGLVYEKGAWVLHMLRARVGTEGFWRGIREYYRRYRDANASTDDFRQVMEQASGQDLQPFFAQWLHRPGHPVIEASWQYDGSRKAVRLHLAQTQPGAAYHLSLDVDVVSKGEAHRHRVLLDREAVSVDLASEATPEEVVLDPDTWLLAEMRLTRRPAPAPRN